MTDFQNPIPVAVGLIHLTGVQGGEPALLGVVRGNAPGVGGIALPGGYVDKGESIEDALVREFWEECGVQTAPDDWKLLQSFTTAENRVLIFGELKYPIAVEHISFDRPPCEEVLRLIPITAESSLVFPSHERLAKACLKSNKNN